MNLRPHKRDLIAAKALVRDFSGTDADSAWREYLDAKQEALKEELIDASNTDAIAAQIKILR